MEVTIPLWGESEASRDGNFVDVSG
jgi:hypothetical protein